METFKTPVATLLLIPFVTAMLLMPACGRRHDDGGQDASSDGGSPTSDGGSDGGAQDAGRQDAGVIDPQGTRVMTSCAGLSGSTQSCEWQWRVEPSLCSPSHPCSKLIVFYAGGEQDCSLQGYQDMLAAYSADGYVAVCVQLFENSVASGAVPYYQEAPRVDATLKDVEGSPVGAAWTGEDLLISGVSHGATAPVTAMARTNDDDGPAWHGTKTTGACFYDGIYDLRAIDDLLGTGASDGSPCTFPVSHARIVGRYYTSDPTSHSCDNAKCACDARHSPDMDMDSITHVPASEFAIADFKLIECGSALAPCTGDIVPAAPIAALCTQLQSSAGHRCTYDSMPSSSHLACAREGIDRCRLWFDSLAVQ